MATVLPLAALAEGVLIVDGKSIIQHSLEIEQMSRLTEGRGRETERKARLADLHKEQLDALDATVAMMTGNTPWIGDLEAIPGAEAEVLYDVEADSPYAARLFGDGRTGIEEMIVTTAKKYAGHPVPLGSALLRRTHRHDAFHLGIVAVKELLKRDLAVAIGNRRHGKVCVASRNSLHKAKLSAANGTVSRCQSEVICFAGGGRGLSDALKGRRRAGHANKNFIPHKKACCLAA